MKIRIKRVYEKPDKEDGIRILVDKIWPRGLTKEKAGIDLWLKDIAPGTELRKWFGHDTGKWEEFRRRYLLELEANEEQVSLLMDQMKKGAVTLVYGANDEKHNQAVILKEFFSR